MVPVFLQTTLATVGALVLQFREARQQRARISAALGRYVPPRLVERLVDESRASAAAVEIVHGTCMATDAAQYTLMAETLAPDELTRLMNAYYELLFTEVERFGGQVSDVVGDAMMAIWASSRPEITVQRNACDAALHLAAELQARALAGDRAALPTRIGLHSGEIRLGEIGARQHFEYRAVGDIVNTATRIESLNKQLGTRILVSAEALAGVGGLATREVGTFLLAGKTVPVVVHELLGQAERQVSTAAPNAQLFSEALAEFRAGRWCEARQLFARYLERVADDGPARYYLRLCEEYLATGPVSFTGGAVRIQAK
jgi:adenylate cyclase